MLDGVQARLGHRARAAVGICHTASPTDFDRETDLARVATFDHTMRVACVSAIQDHDERAVRPFVSSVLVCSP